MFGGSVKKGIFNCFFCWKNMHRVGWELDRVIKSKHVYVAITDQPKQIALYQATYCQAM